MDPQQPRRLLRGYAGRGAQACPVLPADGLVRQRVRGAAVDVRAEAPAGVFRGRPVESNIQTAPAGGTGHQDQRRGLPRAGASHQSQLVARHEQVPCGQLFIGRLDHAASGPPFGDGCRQVAGREEVRVRAEPCPQRIRQPVRSAVLLRDPPARVGQSTEDEPDRPRYARAAGPPVDQGGAQRGGACDLIGSATDDRGQVLRHRRRISSGRPARAVAQYGTSPSGRAPHLLASTHAYAAAGSGDVGQEVRKHSAPLAPVCEEEVAVAWPPVHRR